MADADVREPLTQVGTMEALIDELVRLSTALRDPLVGLVATMGVPGTISDANWIRGEVARRILDDPSGDRIFFARLVADADGDLRALDHGRITAELQLADRDCDPVVVTRYARQHASQIRYTRMAPVFDGIATTLGLAENMTEFLVRIAESIPALYEVLRHTKDLPLAVTLGVMGNDPAANQAREHLAIALLKYQAETQWDTYRTYRSSDQFLSPGTFPDLTKIPLLHAVIVSHGNLRALVPSAVERGLLTFHGHHIAYSGSILASEEGHIHDPRVGYPELAEFIAKAAQSLYEQAPRRATTLAGTTAAVVQDSEKIPVYSPFTDPLGVDDHHIIMDWIIEDRHESHTDEPTPEEPVDHELDELGF